MSFLRRLLGGEDYEEKLLETLVDKGLISLDRAQEYLVSVRNTGHRAAELVVKSGAVPEGVLMAFLARHVKTAPLDVTKFPVRQNITSLISAEVAVAGRVLPMEKIGSSLTLAMSNPLDKTAIEKVEKLTGLKVKVVVTGAAMMLKRLKEAYPDAENLLKSETPTGIEAMIAPKEKRAPVRVISPGKEEGAASAPAASAEAADKPPKPKEVEEVYVVIPESDEAVKAEPRPQGTVAVPVTGEECTMSLNDHLDDVTSAIYEPAAVALDEAIAAIVPEKRPEKRGKK